MCDFLGEFRQYFYYNLLGFSRKLQFPQDTFPSWKVPSRSGFKTVAAVEAALGDSPLIKDTPHHSSPGSKLVIEGPCPQRKMELDPAVHHPLSNNLLDTLEEDVGQRDTTVKRAMGTGRKQL